MTIGNSHSQVLSGIWKGVSFNDADTSEITIIHMDMSIMLGVIEGRLRIQPYNNNEYKLLEIKGKKHKNHLSTYQKKRKNSNNFFCFMNLEYDESDGYIKGHYNSDSLKKVVLFKDINLKSIDEKILPHAHWVKGLFYDLNHNISSPEKRREELKNFKFENVYFDYDKFSIRPEHIGYLDKVVQILNGHSDLRVKITGHTDSDGSNGYNIKLSKQRAQILIEYFTSKGIEKSRIVIDFRGENEPIGTNKSKEGKQLNRRVNFTFI